MDVEDEVPEKVVLQRSKERYMGISAVHDYIYRPEVYSDKSLYEWVQMAKRVKKPSSGQRADVTESEDEYDVMAQPEPQSLRVLRPRKPIVYTEPDTQTDEFNIQEDDSDIEDSDSHSDSDPDDDQEESVRDTEHGKPFLEYH